MVYIFKKIRKTSKAGGMMENSMDWADKMIPRKKLSGMDSGRMVQKFSGLLMNKKNKLKIGLISTLTILLHLKV